MPRVKLLYALMIAGTLMCLLQIWIPAYYLTGDGPCHLYNAHILHSLQTGNNTDLYNKFFIPVNNPNPNWLSHLILNGLLYIATPVASEKIFLSLYALILISGFYKLLKQTSGSSSYWITAVFIFVFHHTLAKGFYNFSFGTATYFWMVWCWIRFLKKKNTANTLLFFLLSGVTFFAQLLPFVFGIITCAMVALSYTATQQHKVPFINRLIQNYLTLGILTAPFVALMFWFTNNQGGLNIHLGVYQYRLIELVQFKYLINNSSNEELFAGLTGLTITSLFIYTVVYRIRKKRYISKYDGLLYSAIAIGLVYITFPEDFMQRAILISMRAQLFIMALAVLAIGMALPQKIKNAGGWIIFACFIGVSGVRFVTMQAASDAAADYNSVLKYIQAGSVVLPVDLAPNGEYENHKLIANRNFLFNHALQYSGCSKPMILLDNYEANAGYFPLMWQYNMNPYQHLSVAPEGIEGHPPRISMARYKQVSGILPNYVVIWGNPVTHISNPTCKTLKDSLDLYYESVATSPTGRTQLLHLKAP